MTRDKQGAFFRLYPAATAPLPARIWRAVTIIVAVYYAMFSSSDIHAQAITDSIVEDFRSVVARNFSRQRTMNLSWEMNGHHDYTLSVDDNDVEKGRKRNLNTIRFSTMIPLLKLHKASLYASVNYACYKFDSRESDDTGSRIFLTDDYSHYQGGLNGIYYASLFNKPLILSGEVFADGWNDGWGRLQARMAAILVIKRTYSNSVSLGVMGMTLFNSTPVFPVIAYWHRFSNPRWSIDITLPSQMYLRYDMKHQRISLGASMSSDHFYLHTGIERLPDVCYYTEVVMRPEVQYEYIINRHFYLSARAGVSTVLKGGLYQKNRKGIKVSGENGTVELSPIVKQDRSPIPFFNVGLSYSIFK